MAVYSGAVTKVLECCSTNHFATHRVYKDVLVPLSPVATKHTIMDPLLPAMAAQACKYDP